MDANALVRTEYPVLSCRSPWPHPSGDLTAALARSVSKGMSVLQQDQFLGGGGLAHLNSTKMDGFIIKLIQHPPDFDPRVGVKYG